MHLASGLKRRSTKTKVPTSHFPEGVGFAEEI
jgi:hypothetical protein